MSTSEQDVSNETARESSTATGVFRPYSSDLPKSLDDRPHQYSLREETELYDGWQGDSHFISRPSIVSPLKFNFELEDEPIEAGLPSIDRATDARLTTMLAAQAALQGDETNVDSILEHSSLSKDEKSKLLQRVLYMASSNGDEETVQKLLHPPFREYVEVDGTDDEGNAPLIYACCFGHQDVVLTLLDGGAAVDKQDRNQWTGLMWAMTNRHKEIARILLEKGASPSIRSSTGRTALEFVKPQSEISGYLSENGYNIGNAGLDDFYDAGYSQDQFEREMEEKDQKRRMMMESSVNLEVDLSSLGLDERPETPEDAEETQNFVWDRCLHDQMFVFQESDLDRILDVLITNMVPQRSPSQKPIPANIVFLAARYAHYHATPDLLEALLTKTMDKINDKVERHQWDMTFLAFWISNGTLLMYYLRKDPGLYESTSEFQLQLAELINEIFILIIRDAERRMDKILESALLDHETIPGFESIQFANDWNLFKPKTKQAADALLATRAPPPTKRQAPAPRNITSLLSSTLFVQDLYDVHPGITTQILAQLLYWIGADLFNRVMRNKKYLARTKAMQIRMNVVALEDWARNNNRSPEHYEAGALHASGETTSEAAQRYLSPVIQLLQWLQCFTSLSEEEADLDNLLSQLPALSIPQLLHAASHYRAEVGEKALSKTLRKRLTTLQAERKKWREEARQKRFSVISGGTHSPVRNGSIAESHDSSRPNTAPSPTADDLTEHDDSILLDLTHMLHFVVPTNIDLRMNYGAGLGGMDRERERKYQPSIPPEFLAKLDTGGPLMGKSSVFDGVDWSKEDGEP